MNQIDAKLLPPNPETIKTLDLTENNLTGANDLRFLFQFPNLTTLILDKNQIGSKFIIPPMPLLTTLWVNHNKIENLVVFIDNLQMFCPNLTYLSMMNNKAAPSYFNGGSLVEYNDYRLYVLSKLGSLQLIDHKEIAPEERMQSQAIYGTGRLARYNDYNNVQEKKIKRRRSTMINSSKPERKHTIEDNHLDLVKNDMRNKTNPELDSLNEIEAAKQAVNPPSPSLSMLNELDSFN